MEADENIVICTADTSTSGGLDRCRKDFPDRVVEVGIGEQNLIGVAAGLALEKWSAFAATFAPFVTLRCLEQLKVLVAYNQIPLKIVGYASGLALIDLGHTHCGIDDIAAIRSLNAVSTLAPADCNSLAKLLPQIVTTTYPIYLRLTGTAPCKAVYDQSGAFRGKSVSHELGQLNKLIDGSDILVVANGITVSNAVSAIDNLPNNVKDRVALIDCYDISTRSAHAIQKEISGWRNIIVVEEHRREGGIGEYIKYLLPEFPQCKTFLHLCIPDGFPHASNHEEALHVSGLSEEHITQHILQIAKKL